MLHPEFAPKGFGKEFKNFSRAGSRGKTRNGSSFVAGRFGGFNDRMRPGGAKDRGQKSEGFKSGSESRSPYVSRSGGSRSGYGNRPYSGGGYRGGSRGGFGNRGGYRGRSPAADPSIDISRFINKAVITEEIEVFVPEHKFTDFGLNKKLEQNVLARGFAAPTPIQDRAVPHVMKGEDVVGIANTGTGKTAAFLLPLMHKIMGAPQKKVLVMVPTRELAIQIDEEFRTFAKGLQMYSVCCVGGAAIGAQISGLRRSHNIVIGTPGRITDLVERRLIDLSKFDTAVLDEADRMLDMGFINDMRFLLGKMPATRQTLFFSATLSKELEALISDFLRDPVRISVKTRETSKNIDQDVVRVPTSSTKLDTLVELLKQSHFTKVLIFGRTKHGVEKLARMLVQHGVKAQSIHGDKTHGKRQSALRMFKESHVQALVATDVAARGLDINGISHVINYDVPATYEDYVHRIGRTGRGDKRGIALTFVE